MELCNVKLDELTRLYSEIMGSSDDDMDNSGFVRNFNDFSAYDKSDVDTCAYSNLNNVNV